ncbi:daunorubicin C-13 ketoreductase [Halonotius aquaticus]|uniref:Daunorubicin C-13 ketoreductase n=1 Tax=Halonotius aquaticus TaxID=2216978 RepID=A0A3A6PMJ1_9EURY|nr:SDR family NAD(P)-dependent oxidoreductase [Halonotius aquaticus]RJX42708.1 daunorubicin C-13 ketoreductase [Halonotius aquaticus]
MTQPAEQAGVADIDCAGQTALVTGSTSGIGRETALALGRLGADVMVHGRDADAARAVVDDLTAMGVEATFETADFAAVSAVSSLATAVDDWVDDLDILVNNAGGLFRDGRLTDIGVEYTFHVNHLAPYLLTAELLPTLADDARIVTTASAAHRGASLDLDAVDSVADYSSFSAYQRSKLANIQFAFELARRLEQSEHGITSNTFHPGAIPGSGFTRFLPGPLSDLASLAGGLPFVPTPADGAATAVYLAVSPRVASVSGRYFAYCEPTQPSAAARDRAAARQLFERSAALLDIPDPLSADD